MQLPIRTLLIDSMFAHRVASPFEQALHHRLVAPVCVTAVAIHIYLIRSTALILEALCMYHFIKNKINV